MVHEFPNMLMLMGPHTALGNIPRSIEYSVEWVTGLIPFATKNRLTRLEATPEGVKSWTDHVKALGEGLLSNEVDFLDDRHQFQCRGQADPHRRPLQRQRAGLPRQMRRGRGEGV